MSSITDKNTLTSVLKNHITTIMTRYKGQIYAWVLVTSNVELSSAQLISDRTSSTRSSTKTAPSAIAFSPAFWARTLCGLPSRRRALWIPLRSCTSTITSKQRHCFAGRGAVSDHSSLDTASYAKAQGMVNYVKKWLAEGIPIDGIGELNVASAIMHTDSLKARKPIWVLVLPLASKDKSLSWLCLRS